MPEPPAQRDVLLTQGKNADALGHGRRHAICVVTRKKHPMRVLGLSGFFNDRQVDDPEWWTI
jgi:hypothetical protein